MKDMTYQIAEQIAEKYPQPELIELPSSELDQVGAGLCEPGIIQIDK
jgi:hypothetical protein